MVKVSTLFHRVDGFHNTGDISIEQKMNSQEKDDEFLHEVLSPLEFTPSKGLMKKLLHRISEFKH